MKKQVLLFTVMLTGLAAVAAEDFFVQPQDFNDNYNIGSHFAEPVSFVERGVEFLVFPDGSFDFNTQLQVSSSETYYKSSRSRRDMVNTTYGAPGTVNRIHYSEPRSRGVLITHDNDGKVRRIGNIFINYDRLGRIKRAGSVYMNYQRGNGLLRQVGGLKIQYNRWGEIIHFAGQVNYNNPYVSNHYNSQGTIGNYECQ